ncbi:MAG: hypothetical protein ACR2Q4_10010 [Geminicoccaceae bacterium]
MFSALRQFIHFPIFLTVSLTAIAGCQPPNEPTSPIAGARGDVGDAGEVAKPASSPLPKTVSLDLNDVSILLPPPSTPGDPVLAITDLNVDERAMWPDAAFGEFLAIANSEAGRIVDADVTSDLPGKRIGVNAFAEKSVWHVASIRIDPGAPGLSPAIAEAFGQSPQIRLVLQPVTDGRVVHDVAAHMIYSYTTNDIEMVPGCPLPKVTPDDVAFQRIVDDIIELKKRLAAGEIGGEPVETDGPLAVHPAADPAKASLVTRTAFRNALENLLEAHLDPAKLRAMAIMALPGGRAPEPWFFLAMAADPRTGRFGPVPSPAIEQDRLRFTQMLDARPASPDNPSVSPKVRANNLNPVTCQFEVPVDPRQPGGPKPPAAALGVSTAELFPSGDAASLRRVVDVIADPSRAHFFNTDCVSCHTETRREMDILGTERVAAPVDPAVLPSELWNVRNFGWFPSFLNGGVFATATRRTAAETEEVVAAINAGLEEKSIAAVADR